ncbi:hypothetical protein ACEN2J_19620 [Pseudorhodobacter sp. W20_MBD10_FR17]
MAGGIAIGFLPFVQNYVDAGRLVSVSSTFANSDRGYRLIINPPRHPQAGLFVRWIATQALSAKDFIPSEQR